MMINKIIFSNYTAIDKHIHISCIPPLVHTIFHRVVCLICFALICSSIHTEATFNSSFLCAKRENVCLRDENKKKKKKQQLKYKTTEQWIVFCGFIFTLFVQWCGFESLEEAISTSNNRIYSTRQEHLTWIDWRIFNNERSYTIFDDAYSAQRLAKTT